MRGKLVLCRRSHPASRKAAQRGAASAAKGGLAQALCLHFPAPYPIQPLEIHRLIGRIHFELHAAPMPSAAAPLKRPERSASFASLPDAGQPRAKRQERAPAEPQAEFDHAAPLLPPLGLETKYVDAWEAVGRGDGRGCPVGRHLQKLTSCSLQPSLPWITPSALRPSHPPDRGLAAPIASQPPPALAPPALAATRRSPTRLSAAPAAGRPSFGGWAPACGATCSLWPTTSSRTACTCTSGPCAAVRFLTQAELLQCTSAAAGEDAWLRCAAKPLLALAGAW